MFAWSVAAPQCAVTLTSSLLQLRGLCTSPLAACERFLLDQGPNTKLKVPAPVRAWVAFLPPVQIDPSVLSEAGLNLAESQGKLCEEVEENVIC